MIKRDLYALHDSDLTRREESGCFRVKSLPEAIILNGDGFGIFWAVNDFNGDRKKVNLNKIHSWYCELDEMPKEHQENLIKSSPVLPSLIIESKRGYQLYFDCIDATEENYSEIQDRLSECFFSDVRAKDLSRVLRAPGFFHMKDPKDPFEVGVKYTLDAKYSEKIMLYNFPSKEELEEQIKTHGRPLNAQGNFWDKVYNLDCEVILSRLSGTSYVNGERYTFKRTSKGNKNIYVNGKSTSCFIDSHGRIGSSSGPTIYSWLKYFNHSNKEAYRILIEVAPEVLG